jgi:hypothetical protein
MSHPVNPKRHMPAWIDGMKRAETEPSEKSPSGPELRHIKADMRGAVDDAMSVRRNSSGRPDYPDNFEETP